MEAAPTFRGATVAVPSDRQMMTRFDLSRALGIALDRIVDALSELAVAGLGLGTFPAGRRGITKREPHPWFTQALERCRSQPSAEEKRFFGETAFHVRGRVFAFLGRPDRAAVTVKPPAEDVERLLRRPFVRRARYVGRLGWLTVEMRDEESLRFALGLIDRSYLLAAGAPRP